MLLAVRLIYATVHIVYFCVGTKLMEVMGHRALSGAVYWWDTFPFFIHVDRLSSSDSPVS